MDVRDPPTIIIRPSRMGKVAMGRPAWENFSPTPTRLRYRPPHEAVAHDAWHDRRGRARSSPSVNRSSPGQAIAFLRISSRRSVPKSEPDDSTLDPRSTSAIENDLAQARKRAASADRLFRAGIIAKVEAEQRALRVVQLEAMLAEARLEEARKSRRKRGNRKARSPALRKPRGSRRSGVTAPRSRRPCAIWSGRKSSSPWGAAANPTSIERKRSSQSCSAPRINAGRDPFSPRHRVAFPDFLRPLRGTIRQAVRYLATESVGGW